MSTTSHNLGAHVEQKGKMDKADKTSHIHILSISLFSPSFPLPTKPCHCDTRCCVLSWTCPTHSTMMKWWVEINMLSLRVTLFWYFVTVIKDQDKYCGHLTSLQEASVIDTLPHLLSLCMFSEVSGSKLINP